MSELHKSWGLETPNFKDLGLVLKQCGRAVVREITRCVMERARPDGLPQKQNAPSTILAKGHDHPIAEKRFRFAREATYAIEARDDRSVVIGLALPADAEVAAHLEEKGYDFFGITDKAEEEAYDILDDYLVQKVKDTFEGRA